MAAASTHHAERHEDSAVLLELKTSSLTPNCQMSAQRDVGNLSRPIFCYCLLYVIGNKIINLRRSNWLQIHFARGLAESSSGLNALIWTSFALSFHVGPPMKKIEALIFTVVEAVTVLADE